jgi:hypothetical protein
MANQDEQANPRSHHGITFVRFESDLAIVSDRVPSARSNLSQPSLVGGIRDKMGVVWFNRDTGSRQKLRELVPQVSVCEEGTQAARS